MDIQKNARLTLHVERIVWLLQNGHSATELVEIFGGAAKTVQVVGPPSRRRLGRAKGTAHHEKRG